jgi:shikimate kinase
MNLVLIGYRGSGKSSVGRALAERLGREFADTDAEIERRAGTAIADIFRTQGEPAFRSLERQVVADLAAREGLVLATGGGVVLDPANVAALRRNGKVAWLRCGAEDLARRIAADPATRRTRPDLTPVGGLEEVRRLLAVRTPLYEGAADWIADSDARPVEAIAADLAARFAHARSHA